MAQGSDYHRGDMDIREQVSTYHLIMGFTKWGSLAIASLVLWATLLFCTDNFGFLGATASAAVLVVLGVLLLREKKTAH